VVQQVNNRGLKLLARLSIDPEKTNFWAGPPPGNSTAFAEYAGALAARYNCQPGAVGCIQAYQIWNEPNLAREWGGNRRPNPAEYAAFLREAYAAIKAGNPNAIVINAGMAPTGDNSDNAMPDDLFYDQMYQAMGGNSRRLLRRWAYTAPALPHRRNSTLRTLPPIRSMAAIASSPSATSRTSAPSWRSTAMPPRKSCCWSLAGPTTPSTPPTSGTAPTPASTCSCRRIISSAPISMRRPTGRGWG
jgi:hypothetical protein